MSKRVALASSLAVTALLVGRAGVRRRRLSELSERPPYADGPSPAFVVVVLSLASLPFLTRAAARTRDPRLFWTLLAAQQLRFAMAIVQEHVSYALYKEFTDAEDYHRAGVRLARRFRTGNFDPRLGSPTGMSTIRFITGLVHTIVGPSKQNASLVFSWLGFWGLYLFYRAFEIGVPDGDAHAYLLLLFFFPSLLFFPSSISKEAWMLLALGMGSLGAVHLLAGFSPVGLSLLVAGTLLAGIVRPHMAAMFGLAFVLGAAPLLWRLGTGVRFALLTAAAMLVAWALHFLSKWGVGPGRDLVRMLEEIAARSRRGASSFSPAIPRTPLDVPKTIVSVFFRPHLFEARSTQVRLAALESSFLLVLSAARMRSAFVAVTSPGRSSYPRLALTYAGLFAIGYSWAANFGLLVRERTQLLPLYFVPFVARRRSA